MEVDDPNTIWASPDGFVPTWDADVDENGNWTFHADPLPTDDQADVLSPEADPLSDFADEPFVTAGNN